MDNNEKLNFQAPSSIETSSFQDPKLPFRAVVGGWLLVLLWRFKPGAWSF
jgi:hypothetical protein